MSGAALIELLFSFGVVLALAVWDLARTPRPRGARSGETGRAEPDAASGSREPGHPER